MKRPTAILLVLCASISLLAQERFCIAKDGKAATILVDENDWKGVIRAAHDLGDDVKKVTGTAAEVVESNSLTSHILPLTSIYVGTIGKSRIIDRLIKQKKLDVKIIKGRWEAYKICVVDGISLSQVVINEAPSTVSMSYPSGWVCRLGTGWLMRQ